MNPKLRICLMSLLLACSVPAWADTKILTYTAQISRISINNDFAPPPPADFKVGDTFTGRWTLESGQPGGWGKVLDTEMTIGDVHLWSSEGITYALGNGRFSAESGFLVDIPGSMHWDYHDKNWVPDFLSFAFEGATLRNLESHMLPSAAQLAMASPESTAFCIGKDTVPMYCYVSQISNYALLDVSPVPEPQSWLLLLAGTALLLLGRSVKAA